MLLNIDVLEPGGRGMALEWTEAVDWKRYICRYSDCVCTEHTNQPDQRVRVLLNFDEVNIPIVNIPILFYYLWHTVFRSCPNFLVDLLEFV